MSIIKEIIEWSKNLPKWQQRALVLLYSGSNSEQEIAEEVFEFAKAEFGIGVVSDSFSVNKDINLENFAAATEEKTVQLVAVENLQNVNAMANNQRLEFAINGMTVIYGNNGTGKSGYTRVLKKACRARDQQEKIISNVYNDNESEVFATANFEILVDGTKKVINWMADEKQHEQLSSVAVFDSRCERAFIDNEGDFEYKPFGLDMLHRLVNVCNQVKKKAEADKEKITPTYDLFETQEWINFKETTAGKLVDKIKSSATVEDVNRIQGLNVDDKKRLNELENMLSEKSPTKKAQELQSKAKRLRRLKQGIEDLITAFDNTVAIKLRKTVEKYRKVKQASNSLAQEFNNNQYLPGTGNEEWKILFNAAKRFAAHSHSEQQFTNISPDSLCPLCQNILGGKGVARIKAFEKYISNDIEQQLYSLEKSAKTIYKRIKDTAIADFVEDTSLEEIKTIDEKVYTACIRLKKIASQRRENIMSAANKQLDWDKIPNFSENPCEELEVIIEDIFQQAESYIELSNENIHAKAVLEKTELLSRQKFGEMKNYAKKMIAQRDQADKLQMCIMSANSVSISTKATQLAQEIATDDVICALNKELCCFGIGDRLVTMKPETRSGKTNYKLYLKRSSNVKTSRILSEGEQSAIAIASFLAETQLHNNAKCIVFDDPVSSLDHLRRERIAERLIEEARTRQVIIFTHDMYFTSLLLDLGKEIVTIKQIEEGSGGFGMLCQLPEHGTLNTAQRVCDLENMYKKINKLINKGKKDDAIAMVDSAFLKLRKTWESAIEEVLFNRVIVRFRNRVATQRLKNVLIDDCDYYTIQEGMTICSKYCGHSASQVAQSPAPTVADLQQEIDRFKDWHNRVVSNKKEVGKRRDEDKSRN